MDNKYSPDELMRYHIALGIADNLEKEHFVTHKDKLLLYAKIAEKYGITLDSIFWHTA